MNWKPLQNLLHMASVYSLLSRTKLRVLMFSLSETFFNFKMGFNWKKLFHPESFCQKLESMQYKAALSVAIQSTFRETLNENWVWKHSDLADCWDVLPVCSNLRFRKLYRKTPVPWSLFYQSCRPEACNLIKKDSGTCAFLWILRNFQEHLFL